MTETKNTLTQLREKLESEIALRQRRLGILDALSGKLSELNLPATFYGEKQIDFDRLRHADVIKVIRVFGGKWSKEPAPHNEGTINYTLNLNDALIIRCWAGQPPPNCKMVEVDEVIPAQPDRRVKRMKLVCTEAEPEAPRRKLVLDA